VPGVAPSFDAIDAANVGAAIIMNGMTPHLAITRDVSPDFGACELTHLERVPIDVDRARAQHRAYEQALMDAGYRIERLAAGHDLPDSVFVEDVAIVFDEVAIVTRPGAASRRAEVPAVATALAPHRRLEMITPPGTIDGGDVLVVGRHVFVGRSSRTNADAIHQVRGLLKPFGYQVREVEVSGCLHLKSAVTAVGDDLLLANPDWIDCAPLLREHQCAVIELDPAEPFAANALRLADRVILPAAFPRTAARLRARGLRVETVDVSELAKAEGAVTCCSVLVEESRA
jgi:dimethylargininase